MQGFIFGGNAEAQTPEELVRRRAIADQLRAQPQAAPRTIGQGLTAIGQALGGRIAETRLKRQEDEARRKSASGFSELMASYGMPNAPAAAPAAAPSQGGSPAPSGPPAAQTIAGSGGGFTGRGPGPGGMPAPATPTGPQGPNGPFNTPPNVQGAPPAPPAAPQGGSAPNPMIGFRNRIAGIESAGSGDYAAIGPTHPKMGRALGRYQIMEANLPEWSQAALGRPVSADEFMASPEIQDAIFDHRFGQYVQQHGPDGAAAMWFSGSPDVNSRAQDSLGTSVSDYVTKFNGGQPGAPAAGMGAPDLERLQQLHQYAFDPMLDEGSRRMAQALLQQELTRMDPAAQLQMQIQQAQLAKLQRPDAPDPTTKMRDFERAQQDPEYAKFLAGNKPTTNIEVNTGPSGIDYGDPPRDTVWQRDENGDIVLDDRGAPIAVPVQGGTAYADMKAAEAEAAAAEERQNVADENTARAGAVVLEDIGRIKEKMQEAFLPTTGLVGDVLKDWGGTAAHDVKALLSPIVANIGFDRLQQMREASKTGGALGAISDRELSTLQAVLGSLEQSQSEDQFLENLERVGEIYNQIMLKAQAYPNAAEFGFAPTEDVADEGGLSEDDLRWLEGE